MAVFKHHMTPKQLLLINNGIPKIVIAVGEMDRVIDWRCSRDLHSAMPNSTLHVWPDRGHGLVEDSEDEILQIIHDNVSDTTLLSI